MSWLVILRPARDGIRSVLGEPDPFGIGISPLRDRTEVEAMLADDPAVTSGAMNAEIRPMRIVTR